MPADGDVLSIARMLRIAGREIMTKRNANAATLGMTSAQADALTFIREHPGCRIADLQCSLDASHQAARTMADRLRERGLIEVRVSDEDARARTLALTPEGVRLHDRFLSMGVEENSELLRGLDENEVRDLKEILRKLIDGLRRRPPDDV